MSVILNYDQQFSFCGQNLSGVSDITFKSDFGVGYTPTLGTKSFGFHKTGPSVGSVDFSRSLIYADPVLQYTGNSVCSGSLSCNGISYNFESGYLTSYAISCSVGQVPNVSAAISVFGEMKSGANNQTFAPHSDVFIPSPRSISISNSYGQVNRIKSFDWSVAIPRQPKYSIGPNLFPDEVFSPTPLQIVANATFNVSGFSPLDLHQFVRHIDAPTFTINIRNRDLSQNLMTLPVNNAQIISQQVQGTVDSPLSITIQYAGYLE